MYLLIVKLLRASPKIRCEDIDYIDIDYIDIDYIDVDFYHYPSYLKSKLFKSLGQFNTD